MCPQPWRHPRHASRRPPRRPTHGHLRLPQTQSPFHRPRTRACRRPPVPPRSTIRHAPSSSPPPAPSPLIRRPLGDCGQRLPRRRMRRDLQRHRSLGRSHSLPRGGRRPVLLERRLRLHYRRPALYVPHQRRRGMALPRTRTHVPHAPSRRFLPPSPPGRHPVSSPGKPRHAPLRARLPRRPPRHPVRSPSPTRPRRDQVYWSLAPRPPVPPAGASITWSSTRPRLPPSVADPGRHP